PYRPTLTLRRPDVRCTLAHTESGAAGRYERRALHGASARHAVCALRGPRCRNGTGPARRRRAHGPRDPGPDPGRRGPPVPRRAGAAERQRRPRGLPPGRPRGAHAGRLRPGLPGLHRGRLVGPVRQRGARRPGAAHLGLGHRGRDAGRIEYLVRALPAAVRRRLSLHPRQRHPRTAGRVRPQAGQRGVDRHHVPDRTACRHRPGHAAHQGRTSGRRQLQVPARRRRHAGRAQRRLLRLHRAQDGHPRQRHLRDELRRRRGLPGRRAEQGPGSDVHHDELRASGHGRAGPGADRDRLAEIAGLRRRAPAIARAGAGAGGHAGRSHPAAAGRAAHAAHAAGLGAGRAHVPVLAGLADRRRAACVGPGRARPRGRPAEPADAGGQGLRVRQRRRVGEPGDAGPWRQRLHRRVRHRADAARRAHPADLRGHQRRAGARSAGPQGAGGRRRQAGAAAGAGAGTGRCGRSGRGRRGVRRAPARAGRPHRGSGAAPGGAGRRRPGAGRGVVHRFPAHRRPPGLRLLLEPRRPGRLDPAAGGRSPARRKAGHGALLLRTSVSRNRDAPAAAVRAGRALHQSVRARRVRPARTAQRLRVPGAQLPPGAAGHGDPLSARSVLPRRAGGCQLRPPAGAHPPDGQPGARRRPGRGRRGQPAAAQYAPGAIRAVGRPGGGRGQSDQLDAGSRGHRGHRARRRRPHADGLRRGSGDRDLGQGPARGRALSATPDHREAGGRPRGRGAGRRALPGLRRRHRRLSRRRAGLRTRFPARRPGLAVSHRGHDGRAEAGAAQPLERGGHRLVERGRGRHRRRRKPPVGDAALPRGGRLRRLAGHAGARRHPGAGDLGGLEAPAVAAADLEGRGGLPGELPDHRAHDHEPAGADADRRP
uniref:Heterodimeric efflux ABC transporter, permease/ATP-binding subunit 2 n=1 Tax=Parastrongyloides trichosuri TaxID=131310 RepID=A0A0N4ZCU8_PARTI